MRRRRLTFVAATPIEKYGVELGEQAKFVAKSRSVNIICKSFHKLQQINENFDIVIAIDVIEHHPRPAELLGDCLGPLKPGWLSVLTTGAADAALWYISRGKYWYCQFAEHLAFVSPNWFRRVCNFRYDIKVVKYFSYIRRGIRFKPKN